MGKSKTNNPKPYSQWTAQERSSYKVEWAKAKRHRLRLELIARYGGKCACCGVNDYRWLSLHHKNRDGGRERKGKKVNAANRIAYLHSQPKRDDLELLCYNCHLSGDFFNICPHRDRNSPYYLPSCSAASSAS